MRLFPLWTRQRALGTVAPQPRSRSLRLPAVSLAPITYIIRNAIRTKIINTKSDVRPLIVTSADPTTDVPWLTVIMPSYNGEQWIDSALGSLASEVTEGI